MFPGDAACEWRERGGGSSASLAGARHQLFHRPPTAAAGRGRRAYAALYACCTACW